MNGVVRLYPSIMAWSVYSNSCQENNNTSLAVNSLDYTVCTLCSLVYLSVCLFVTPPKSVCLFVELSVCLSCQVIACHSSVCQSIGLSVSLFVGLSILFSYLFVGLSVCLSVCSLDYLTLYQTTPTTMAVWLFVGLSCLFSLVCSWDSPVLSWGVSYPH